VLTLAVALPLGAQATERADGLAASLASGDRADADKARDAGRKPAEIVAFLGIEPGMTVLDIIAASGYYTEVLSVAVGEKGKVYAQNSAFVLEIREGANEKAISARLAGNRLPNVERRNKDLAEVGLEPGSIDAAITALNFHDIYNGRGTEAAAAFLAAVYELLKPGGVLGIVDHHGNEGADNESLHRIPESQVRAAVEASPFTLEASSELLRNSGDDRSKGVFDASVRGKTDRFVLLMRKPSGS
jgi:predicted methyltransferase